MQVFLVISTILWSTIGLMILGFSSPIFWVIEVLLIFLLSFRLISSADPRKSEFEQQTYLEWEKLLADPGVVFLDTETSGVNNDAEVITVAVVSQNGESLFEGLHLPSCSISREATAVHGFTKALIRKMNHSSWSELHSNLVKVLKQASTVVAYNAAFDKRVLEHTALVNSKRLPKLRWYDAMSTYSGKFKYIRLEDAAIWEGVSIEESHTALGDARLTRNLMLAAVARCKEKRQTPSALVAHRKRYKANDNKNLERFEEASERQVDFIYSLLDEREVPQNREDRILDEIPTMSKGEASKTIDYLLSRPQD